MKKVQRFIADAFNFSPVEVRGFLFLMLTITVLLFLPTAWSLIFSNKTYNPTTDLAILDSLLAEMDIQESIPVPIIANNKSKKYTPKLFRFDPNTVSLNELTSLGIKDFLAERIIKYRNRGGKFYKKDDLLKIYGFPEWLYKKLENYIAITQLSEKKISPTPKIDKDGNNAKLAESTQEKTFERKLLNLNTIDTTQLKYVKGIGSKLAARIVNFREKLGGFHSNEQIKEVYGLSPEVCEKLLEFATVTEKIPVKQFQINQLDEKALQAHPYISWKQAKLIIKYRMQHGAYQSIEDLANIKVFDDIFIKKISPYISFE
ncbi:MAG: helix-hairpin-helix domain-containing protein [Bacteroidota bacterium]